MTLLCRDCGDIGCQHNDSSHLGSEHCFKKVADKHQTPPVAPLNSSDWLCVKPGRGCKYYEFYDSVSCLFAEGVEFMTKDEIYAAIKKDWAKLNT